MPSDSRVQVNLTASGATQRSTRSIINRLRAGTFPEADCRALLDALGHGDCVPREQYRGARLNVLEERDRAERAERERDSERDRADGWMGNCALQPCLQDPYNPCEPGWLDGDLNGDEVCPPCWARLSLRDDTGTCVGCGNMTNGWFADGDKGPGWYCGWCPPVPGKPGIALSADADADAEPGLCDIRCRYDDLHTGACLLPEDVEPSRADERTHYMDDGCPGGHRLYDDSDADAEPSTPEAEWRHNFMPSSLYSNCALCWKPPTHELHRAMDCGHDSINYSYVLGHCRACDVEHGEPSRAEGDKQPQSLNDLAREWGLPPLTWVHMGFIEPHEPAPDADAAYMNHEMGRLEAPCLNCRNKIVVAIANRAEGVQSCDCEPIRHGVGEEHQPDCAVRRWHAEDDKVGEHVHECGCIDDVEADGSHTRAVNCDRHMPSPDAEGGRPREADPQGTPSGNGDASVDGGADDGYCRAVQAAIRRLVDRRESGGRHRLDAVERAMLHADAACAVDAALASGGVVTREQLEHADRIEAETASERDRAEARVRKLESALREIADDGAGHGLHPLTRCAVCRARSALEGADRA